MKKSTVVSIFFVLCLCALAQTAQVTNTIPAAPVISLAWNASTSTPSAGYFNYAVWCGTNSGQYTTNYPAGTNLSVVVSNLSRGTVYYFSATVTDPNTGLTSYSTEITYTAPTVPIAVTALRVNVLVP